MYLLNLEQMFKIRDYLIAKTKNANFYNPMCGYMYDKYPHLWKYGEKIAKSDVEVKFDREVRRWKMYHKQGLFKPTSFDKKPSKSLVVLKVLWQVAQEVSQGNQAFKLV